ncbi:MAG TPA: response regulator transcription factor [Hyphomonas sp.]|nr:response regulator transcription factor [Hyphomonas sp.]HPE47818.1 response regulator transcription factor [Hyphomonas sp.]
MSEAAPQRIMVVEDNTTTARSLGLFLEAAGFEPVWLANGREALRQAPQVKPALILLDLNLPDIDGLEVCRTLRRNSQVPIIMLTARTSEAEIVEGLESGADDYVRKPFGARELVARIRRSLAAPARASASARLRVGDLEIDPERRQVTLDGVPVSLTRSEFGILVVLAASPGRVFTRAQLIDRALGPDFDGFDRTIDTHIWSLRRKLGEPRGNPRYIVSELGIGYRMRNGDAS